MEIYRLKGFAAILHEGNLTRAAERLNLSQSALSSQLKQLEEELGVALFRRTPRGMELTDAGRELRPCIEGVLEASERLLTEARVLRQVGGETLNIGLNTDPAFLRVGAINRRLAMLHGEFNVVFVTSQTVRTARLLRQGRLDLAFFYGDAVESGIRHRRLAEVRLCIVVPTSLVKGGSLSDWAAVALLPWVWVENGSPPYDAVQREFERRRLAPNQAVKAADEYIVRELVIDGQGVAVMREDEARFLSEEGRVVIWEKGWLTLPLSLAWMAKNEESRAVRAAREAIVYIWEGVEGPAEGELARFVF